MIFSSTRGRAEMLASAFSLKHLDGEKYSPDALLRGKELEV